jgi:flagellar basal-body rod modification protein FlgD
MSSMQTKSVSTDNQIYGAASGASTAGTNRASSAQQNSVERDAFMELLMMQVKSQDPLNPMDSAQFFNQLAQLSTLEQLWSISETLENGNSTQQLANGALLIGRYVEANSANEGRISGLVDQVRMVSGRVWLKIGEKEVHLEDVLSVQ